MYSGKSIDALSEVVNYVLEMANPQLPGVCYPAVHEDLSRPAFKPQITLAQNSSPHRAYLRLILQQRATRGI